jgi:hypothetical protein
MEPVPAKLHRAATLLAVAFPLLLAASTLAWELIKPYSSSQTTLLVALVSLVVVPVVVGLASRLPAPPVVRLVATPALLAPVAVCFPWTVAPSHLGLGFGDFGYFRHWLTKYPSWGPINDEVLLGILCVLGCAFLPWLAAVIRLHRSTGRLTQLALLGLALIPYIPVLIRLDALLFVAGALAPGPMPRPPIWVTFGPVLRLASILSMAGMSLAGRLPAAARPPDGAPPASR